MSNKTLKNFIIILVIILIIAIIFFIVSKKNGEPPKPANEREIVDVEDDVWGNDVIEIEGERAVYIE